MALIATVGASDANSYVEIAEATDYYADRSYTSAWDDFDDQAGVIILASQMLDWYVTFKGVKTDPTQSMAFPRTGVVRPSTIAVADDIIPYEVKVATFELALASLNGDLTVTSDLEGIDQVRVSSLMIKAKTELQGASKSTLPDKIWAILSDLTNRSKLGTVRLMRA